MVELETHSSTQLEGSNLGDKIENGFYLLSTVEGESLNILIDTGSTISILNTDFAKSLPNFHPLNVQPVSTKLVSVTGALSHFEGILTVDLKIGKQSFKHNMYLANIPNKGILGMDFLRNKCSLLCTTNELLVNEEKVPCFEHSNSCHQSVCKIAITETLSTLKLRNICKGKSFRNF